MIFHTIKRRLDSELAQFIKVLDRQYSLKKISQLLFKSINDFALRDGKRIRPILFVVGYLGFAKKAARGLYKSALSIELLHDFMLIHDDIIDKSKTRRGKPSMHVMLNKYLSEYKNIKFDGQDLGIALGDVIYAMAINAFLSINENKDRKEKALKRFIDTAVYTGCGEFIELINGLKNIKDVSKENIYRIYDYKTANYTFSTPLAMGTILAGTPKIETDKLFEFGTYVGRAFQIKDDILGMFADEKKIGKSTMSDLQEAKRTILIWYAYNHSNKKGKLIIERIFLKRKVNRSDLKIMRDIIIKSGSLDYAKRQVQSLLKKSQKLLASSSIKVKCKKALADYCAKVLQI